MPNRILTVRSKKLINEFVKACVNLDIARMEKLLIKNPSISREPKTLIKRMGVIFRTFQKDMAIVSANDSMCTGCTYGGHVKKFIVTYKNTPHKNTCFSFLLEYDKKNVTNIRECSQNKLYQDKLLKRMTKGLNDQEIKQLRKAGEKLPEIRQIPDKLRIFCYGSNMSQRRLEMRCPNATFLSSAFVTGYVFKFNKKSTLGTGSGKGNIVLTSIPTDIVWGVVFEIPKNQESALDEAEGFGSGGYDKVNLTVKNENGELFQAITYLASNARYIDNNELPFDWYKNHCIVGATEFNLPKTYLDFLNSFESKIDGNKKRVKTETNIYSCSNN